MESDQSNKRQRTRGEAEEGGGEGGKQGPTFRRDEAEFEIGTGWRTLVLRLGEQQYSAEFDGRSNAAEQIELTASVLSRNFDGVKGELLPLLMQCAEELPHKAAFYATLVGILNARHDELGRAIVEHVQSGVQAAIDMGEQHKTRILLRILTLLASNKVVKPADVCAIFWQLVKAALVGIIGSAPKGDARMANGKGRGEGGEKGDDDEGEDEDEEVVANPLWQPRSDSFVFSVLAALPFGAHALHEESADDMSELLALVQRYMDARTPLNLPALSVFAPAPQQQQQQQQQPQQQQQQQQQPDVPTPDYLQDLWERVRVLAESGWKCEAVPRPQETLKELFRTPSPEATDAAAADAGATDAASAAAAAAAAASAGVAPGSSPILHRCAKPTIPPPPTPPPPADAAMEDADEGATSAAESARLAADKERFSALETYPPRSGLLKLFPSAKSDAHMAPIDRFVVQEYLLDVLFYLNGCRKECAAYLVGLPVPFRYEYVMAETVFSQLLLLPRPPFSLVYYTVVLVDLCKALPGAFPAVLASAVRLLFSRMPLMDVECRCRVVQWLAHHLSNFAFVWPWEAWAAVARQPEWSPQRMFCAEVLEKEVRLAYFDKVKQSLGSVAMEELLPPRSAQPHFVYGSASRQQAIANDAAKEASKEADGADAAVKQSGEGAAAAGGDAEAPATGDTAMVPAAAVNGGSSSGTGEDVNSSGPSEEEVALSKRLTEFVKGKAMAREVGAWAEEQLMPAVGMEREKAIDIVAQTLLALGSKSITHSVTVLERYGSVLQKLAPDQASQVLLVRSVVRLWHASPQMAAVVVDRCMGLRLVSNLAIVQWVFERENYNSYHTSDRVWEILRNAIRKTANRTADLEREVAGLQRTAATAAALAAKAQAEADDAAAAAAEGDDDIGAKAAAAAMAEETAARASQLQEEATSAEEAVEAKSALLLRARREQQALFSTVIRSFSEAVDDRLAQRQQQQQQQQGAMEVEAAEGEGAAAAGALAMDSEGKPLQKSKVVAKRKRNRLEELEEREWLRCTLGGLRSICRYYAKEVWQLMPVLQAVLKEVRRDIVDTVNVALLRLPLTLATP